MKSYLHALKQTMSLKFCKKPRNNWQSGGVLALILALAVSSMPSLAQQPTQAEIRKVPLEAMQRLNNLTGKWTSTMSISYDKGKTWQRSKPNQVLVKSRLNGMMLEQSPITKSHNGWDILVNVAYDQYRNTYRYIVSDDVWGMMDIYEGNIDDNGKLIVTNLKSGTFFPYNETTLLAFRISVELDPCKRRMDIDFSADKGENWTPYIVYEYENIEPCGADDKQK